jgi:ubiquinone biosynthesis monooxygenase Coq7
MNPADPSPAVARARALRVDHAGEYGAVRIYAGQRAVLRDPQTASLLAHMEEEERRHLRTFETRLAEEGVRPTALLPLWHVAGFALGAATALLGREAAMACTVAVEEVIDDHYARQIAALAPRDPELAATLDSFRADELAHRDTGLAEGAERAPAYPLLSGLIKLGCRLAITLSEIL